VSDPSDLVITGPSDVVAFLRACGAVGRDRAEILLGLALTETDPLAHVVCGAAIRTGADCERPIDHRQLVDLADELVVGALVLAAVTPNAPRPPSRSEIERFVSLRRGCADEGVAMLDWIVVTERHWWSMRERVIHEAA